MVPKKVLITGGYGFVGARLARHLHDKGLEVLILEQEGALAPFGLEKLQVLRADITDEQSMAKVKAANIDAVIHLAAQSSGPRSFSVPLLDVRLNILGTINVIDWCVENSIDRLLFASSFVVCGDHADREALTEDMPCKPNSVYATSKLACEHLLKNYAEPKGIRWSALRMYNVYGPGQDITKPDQGVVGIFMNMLRHQDEVVVKGRLDRFRDLIYIDDVIQGWDLCLHSRSYNEIFNLGTGVKTTYNDLIRMIARTMNKEDKLRIVEAGGTPGDMMGCYADLTRFKKAVGYNPKVELMQGLNEMWIWVQNSEVR
jgi:UDP-glucose 4-epimerase